MAVVLKFLRIMCGLLVAYTILLIVRRFILFDYDNREVKDFLTKLIHLRVDSDYSINNTLFLSNSHLKLPKNNGDIFGWMKIAIFPDEKNKKIGDRIFSQMRYVPSNYDSKTQKKYKLILLYNGYNGNKDEDFQRCPVSHCKLTDNKTVFTKADIVIWIGQIPHPYYNMRPPNQIWSFFFHESPKHTPNIKYFENRRNSMINWTITYRPDSTIPVQYAYYIPYDLTKPPPKRYPPSKKEYHIGKTKMAAWFASNCKASNNRYEFIQELNTYIEVDSYGDCGSLKCPRNKELKCFRLLSETYKFYLSIENSNCRHYITEKLFINGLSQNVLPIVMGAHPDDYKRVAPPHSYIHVDDFETVKDLANYLKYLDKNHTAYNEYFSWKEYGTVNFDQNLFCRICMMAYEAERTKTYYNDLHKWWNGKDGNICFKSGKWKDQKL